MMLPDPSEHFEPIRIHAVEKHITVETVKIDDKKPTINGHTYLLIPVGFEAFFVSNGKDYSAILRKAR